MKKILKYLIPIKLPLTVMIILLFLQILGTLFIPTLTADIVNNGIIDKNMDYILSTGVIMIGVSAIAAVVSILGTYLSSHLAATIGKNIRYDLMRKSQDFSLNEFNHFGTSSMITRSTSDIMLLQQTFSLVVEMLLPAPVMIIVGLTLAFRINRTAGFIIVGAMILIVLITLLIGKRFIPMFDKLQTTLDKINRLLREHISGIRVIRAFNQSEGEKKKEDTAFLEYADTSIKVNKIFALVTPLIMVVLDMSTVLIIWFGGTYVTEGAMQIGDILALIEYALLILSYMIMAIMAFIMVPRAQISAQRITEVLNYESDTTITNTAAQTKSDTDGKLSFKDVTYRYLGAEKPVLEDISFSVQPGQTLAIIGSTGSGKSTIANLIPRFFDIESGEISVDGMNIQQMKLDELRNKVGYIPQKAFLFSGTIADNLRHGNPKATLKEMDHAATIAQAKDFIDNLKDGYESTVAQAGNNFSGGQKQRLSIARAIIKKPEIYVFDDSFSALDFKTDARLRKALKMETINAAVVVIAQRVSSIMDADQILVLDKGKAVGLGTHKELMKNSDIYKQIAQSQLSEEELA